MLKRFLPTIRDSRNRESHTLFFVAVAALVLVAKFSIAGMVLFGQQMPVMSATEFGVAFAAVMAAWLGREWTEKAGSK